jgi:hypothetical protein
VCPSDLVSSMPVLHGVIELREPALGQVICAAWVYHCGEHLKVPDTSAERGIEQETV